MGDFIKNKFKNFFRPALLQYKTGSVFSGVVECERLWTWRHQAYVRTKVHVFRYVFKSVNCKSTY